MTGTRTARWAAATAAAAMAPCAANAHIIGADLGAFYAGALHPLTGVEDVVLWLSLGLLIGTQPATGRALAVLAFPAGLLAGAGLAGAFGLGDGGTVWVAAGLAALGGLLASAQSLPRAGLIGLACALGVSRGIGNAAGMSPGTDVPLYLAGLALAGYAVVIIAAAAAASFVRPADPVSWRGVMVRAYGGWIAAIGIMVGAYAFR